MEMPFMIALLILLTLSSAFFSSSEVALFSLSSMQIKAYQSDADKRKRLIAKLVGRSRELLVTVFMLNTFINILLQNVASDMFEGVGGWAFSIGIPLALTLVVGEVIPKNIGIQNNTFIAYHVAPLINFFQRALGPLRRLAIAITNPISRILFFYLKKADPISKEELYHALKTSQEHGLLNPQEGDLVKGFLTLQEATVREVMRQKNDILYYTVDEPLSKLTHLFVEEECSRIPVCEDSIQNVIGIITAKNYFINQNSIHKVPDLISLLKKPFFVPESIPARLLIKRLREHDETFALAINEYGSITGLVTMEDIAELVVGDIEDLRDESKLYTKAGKNEIIANGTLELLEIESIFGEELKSENSMVTIGGWLIEKMGEIPKGGTKYETEKFLFQILAAEPTHINSVYIRMKAGKHRK